ncbi:MAG: beta-lactamase family protein [Actinobacteria bacterium]|nr:MAG: beta-lactamase family protein [Actinomycetota bacterium]
MVALEPFELDGAAYGGLVGPVLDAARLVALHCNDGMFAGRRLLASDSVRAMADIATKGKPYDVGLGWFRPRRESGPGVQHFGGGMGFWNVLRLDPTTGRGAAVMSNTNSRWEITKLADDAISETLGSSSRRRG